MEDAQKAKEQRSPSFPFITLERALERAREFYAEEKRGAAPHSRAVMHWKYGPSSSGGLQTISALKHYGLLEDVGGSGKDRQLKLTDLALRIILDQRPDSSERDEYIRQAALSPTLASEIYERWPDGLPSDSTLNHFLVLEKKFNETTALNSIKIIKENQLLANIKTNYLESINGESEKDYSIKENNLNVMTTRQDLISRNVPRLATTQASQQHLSATPANLQRVLAYMGVGITIYFTEEPTKEAFEYLARYCAFEKENVPSKAEMETNIQA